MSCNKECCKCGITFNSSENIFAKTSDDYYCSVECLVKPKFQ